MSNCNTCGKSFGFFNRELGCAKCNRLFCKKCLIYKFQDENKRNLLCCLKCHTIGENSTKSPAKDINVEQLLQIQADEASQQPVLEPIAKIDDIRNLKGKSGEVDANNIDDIHKRLANLKDEEFKPTQKILFKNDDRTEIEKVEDLIKQFVEEKDLNTKEIVPAEQPGSVDDIERRLAALRGIEVSQLKIEQRDETELEEIDRTVYQYIEEAKLPNFDLDPDEKEFIESIPPAPQKDLEELPFCEICNEDAVLRCLQCENLFCHKCFMEFHDEEDYRSHKTKPYTAPNHK